MEQYVGRALAGEVPDPEGPVVVDAVTEAGGVPDMRPGYLLTAGVGRQWAGVLGVNALS